MWKSRRAMLTKPIQNLLCRKMVFENIFLKNKMGITWTPPHLGKKYIHFKKQSVQF